MSIRVPPIRVPPRKAGVDPLSGHGPSGNASARSGVDPSRDGTLPAVDPLPVDVLPDVRDGLTRAERTVLWVLHQTQKERGGRSVPTTMLWGRVCEYFYISPESLSEMLARLGARKAR